MFLGLLITVVLFSAGAALLLPWGSPGVANGCDLVAAPGGSPRAAGTREQPTDLRGLIRDLRRGQVGCLRGGEYRFDELELTRPELELTSYAGERAVLRGRLWVADGADGNSFRDLFLVGVNDDGLPSPTVNADHTTFSRVDVTNHHTGICFDIGNVDFGRAVGTVIEDSRIHDCGRFPATNTEHGIYLSDAEETTIEGNWIYDNADRGIQLYPYAQATRIVDNVIYGNGEGIIFSGNDEVAAGDTLVEGNVIAESRIRRNVESSYPIGGPVGERNRVTGNCFFGAASPYYDGPGDSGVEGDPRGFTVTDSIVARPDFVDPATADFRLRPGSPCEAVGAAGLPVPGANS